MTAGCEEEEEEGRDLFDPGETTQTTEVTRNGGHTPRYDPKLDLMPRSVGAFCVAFCWNDTV